MELVLGEQPGVRNITDMQNNYLARYPTDDWHLAKSCPLVYFSLVVHLRELYRHFVSLRPVAPFTNMD